MDDYESKSGVICRVCLRYDVNKCISLFEEYNDCLISEKITSIANVHIQKNDGLPNRICPDCLLELENAIKFKQKCENSNEILHSASITKPEVPLLVKVEISPDFVSTDGYLESDYENEVDIKPAELFLQNGKKSRAIDLRLECHDCGGFFKSKCKLRVHWKRAHQASQLVCDICKRQFKSYKAYHLHKKRKSKACTEAARTRIEGQGRGRTFHCKECNYQSKRIKDMATHSVLHTGLRPFVCNICHKGFTQQSSLQSHQEGKHKDYKVEATCEYCGKHLKGRTRVYRHLKMHTDNQVQCEVCKKTLKSKQYLKQHMKRHSNIKAYACEVCASTFYTSADLANHKRSLHNKEKKYKCEKCNYLSYRACTIKKHLAKHTATNIPCLICGMFVDNAEEFVVHQRRHFDKKYECPHCNSKFYSKKNLGRHVRVKHNCTMLVNKVSVRPASVKAESPNSGQFGDARSPVKIEKLSKT
ncbi:zinc finger protein 28 [Manduca sexta]|uniref:zinc finger protein 28 n=1 Tax=Manduca sexta TaxID=7130 RepID=UPI00188E36D3|nr:zinc finger protein 28 [Manduca sexta]